MGIFDIFKKKAQITSEASPAKLRRFTLRFKVKEPEGGDYIYTILDQGKVIGEFVFDFRGGMDQCYIKVFGILRDIDRRSSFATNELGPDGEVSEWFITDEGQKLLESIVSNKVN